MPRRRLFWYAATVLLVAMPIAGFAFKGQPGAQFSFAHYDGSAYQWLKGTPYELEFHSTRFLPKDQFFPQAQQACRSAGFQMGPGDRSAELHRNSGLEIVKLEYEGSGGQIEYVHPVTGLKSVWVAANLTITGDPSGGESIQD